MSRPSSGQQWPRLYSEQASESSITDIQSRLSSLGILVKPVSNTTQSDEFSNATVAPWTWYNQSASVATIADDCLVLTIAGSSGDSLHIYEQALRASGNTDYTVTARGWFKSDESFSQLGGVCLRESSNSKIQTMYMGRLSSSPNYRIGNSTYSNVTTFAAHLASSDMSSLVATQRPFIFQVKKSGNTIDWRYSLGDGGFYDSLYSNVTGAFFTTRPDTVGVFLNTNQTDRIPKIAFSWVRVSYP